MTLRELLYVLGQLPREARDKEVRFGISLEGGGYPTSPILSIDNHRDWISLDGTYEKGEL